MEFKRIKKDTYKIGMSKYFWAILYSTTTSTKIYYW